MRVYGYFSTLFIVFQQCTSHLEDFGTTRNQLTIAYYNFEFDKMKMFQ